MITIVNIDNNTFSINGITYKKIFVAVPAGSVSIRIVSAYDSKFEILPATKFTDVTVNGIAKASQVELISSVIDIVLNRISPSDVTSKLDKDGFVGSAKTLKEQIDAVTFEGAKTYDTLQLAKDFYAAADPKPVNGTGFKVSKVTDAANAGNYTFQSGSTGGVRFESDFGLTNADKSNSVTLGSTQLPTSDAVFISSQKQTNRLTPISYDEQITQKTLTEDRALTNTGGTITIAGYKRNATTTRNNKFLRAENRSYFYSGTIQNTGLAGVCYSDENDLFISAECTEQKVYVDYPLNPPSNARFIFIGGFGTPILKRFLTERNVYPFKRNSLFFSDRDSVIDAGIDIRFIKDFIIDIKFEGVSGFPNVSPYVVRRNDSGLWQIMFFKDTGTGNGDTANRELFFTWEKRDYVENNKITATDNGITLTAFVNWDAVPKSVIGSITYNAAGFDKKVFANFKSAAPISDTPQVSSLALKYNNTDAVTSGTKLYSQFTVVANVDGSGNTLGCTGFSINTDTNEFIVSEYGYAISSRLLIYRRKDLTPYSPSGTIIPTPTRVIDVSSYLFHIQGNVYDPETKTIWVIGAQNAVSSNVERKLIRVDLDGNLIESTILSSFSFQAGMIVLSPDYKNLLIKPNDKTQLYEIDKETKSLIRTVDNLNLNEGLAVDYKNSFVWIGGDNGELKKYNYSNFSQVGTTYTYSTLPNGSNTNVEGMAIDAIDGSLIICGDAYLHGTNNNGNCIWVFDFENKINKSIQFPDMYRFPSINNKLEGSQTWESPVFDFGSFRDFITNAISIISQNATVTVTYRGSNTAPTTTLLTRTNWRDRPTYNGWGSTTPSTYASTPPNNRYIQLKLIIS